MALACASKSVEATILSTRRSRVSSVGSINLGTSFVCSQSVTGIQTARIQSAARKQRAVVVSEITENEVIEVELEKPYGLKFYKGIDGATYIDALAAGQSGALSGKIAEGDKVLATSAVFGDDIWPSAEYGRTMYTVKNRVGPLLMRIEKQNGFKIEKAKAKDAYAQERNAGNYGDAIREKQIDNYTKKKEYEVQRAKEQSEGLELYRQGKYEEALIRFQTILVLQPPDRERAVTGYNIACSYSKLNEIELGLDALEIALEAGFEDYKAVRTDPDLANIRASDSFDALIKRFDEPFINENAIKAISSVFGFFGGKK